MSKGFSNVRWFLGTCVQRCCREVELNDDNQIVDHRDLLSAGLNLGGVNTRRLGLSKTQGAKKDEGPAVEHRAAGTAAS